MKSRIISFAILFLLVLGGNGLFAFGKKDTAEEKKPINHQWTLCITAFDTSAMSPSWQTAGDTVARSFASALQNLDFRFREEDEAAYYRSYALQNSRSQAADAVAKKRNERDLLIFKGDPEWKYQNDLKVIDEAILKLEEALAETDVPPVEAKPVFSLVEANKTGTFPPPPDRGKEYRFLTDQKADAFLTGKLSEYYGRIYLETWMYTRYTNSYSYEDSILFSSDDFNGAMAEVSNNLAIAVSKIIPSSILVHASPPEAMIMIDNSYFGQGEIESHMRSPGTAELTVYADNHVPVLIPLELNAGELTEVFINLTPLGVTAFEAYTSDSPGSRVYLGSLYAGETPLTLSLPSTRYSYVSVETPGGETGSVILRDNNMVRGSAQFTRKDESLGRADFLTAPPISQQEKQVENARNSFYNMYGAFWFVLPATLLTAGIAGTYIFSSDYVAANNLYSGQPDLRSKITRGGTIGSIARVGAYGLMGGSLGYTFFQIFKYLSVSGGDSTPIAKDPKP